MSATYPSAGDYVVGVGEHYDNLSDAQDAARRSSRFDAPYIATIRENGVPLVEYMNGSLSGYVDHESGRWFRMLSDGPLDTGIIRGATGIVAASNECDVCSAPALPNVTCRSACGCEATLCASCSRDLLAASTCPECES